MSAIKTKIQDINDQVVNLNVTTPLGPVAPLADTPEQLSELAPARPTVNLFDQSTYQAQASVTLADGSVITLPGLSADEAAQAQSLFANVAPEHQEAVNAAASTFAKVLLASDPSANTIVDGPSKLASGSNAAAITVSQVSPDVANAASTASATYKSSLTPSYGSNSGAKNYEDTVQAVAYMGVLGLQNELGTFAQTVQTTQNTQNTLRADQSELQTATASWGDDVTATQNFTWHEVDKDGNVVTKSGDLTKAQATAALANVNSALSSYTDMNQMQAIQLQNMTQNYQNGLTTISNLMKAAYDMTKNTIGNIHY